MRVFQSLNARVLPLDRANIDTDSIIPKQYLKSIERAGYGAFLFDNWRYLDPGSLTVAPADRRLNPDFILNRPGRQEAAILLARQNFGCGSSREHAVWALLDYGIQVVIAASFSDIFSSNAAKNGLLLICLEDVPLDRLFACSLADPAWRLGVDLQRQELYPQGESAINFAIAAELKERLLNGWDEIALTLRDAEAIRAYESRRASEVPWLFPKRTQDK